jgi:prepilin-type N-terminal cleavage/methylation domain-containing protein
MYLLSESSVMRGTSGKGFTLLEVLLATIILGIGIAAALNSMITGTMMNAESEKLTNATFLAQEIREWTQNLPFSDPDTQDMLNPPGPDSEGPYGPYVDDLDDLLDAEFSPPLDSMGNQISGMSGWTQQITLSWRSEDDPSITVAVGSSNVIYVQVRILSAGEVILNSGWLCAREQD